jgi:transposase-like protein
MKFAEITSLRQKCLIHRCRNVLAKVPAAAQDEIRDAYWAIFDTDALTAAGAGPGHKLVTAVQARIDTFAQTYGTLYPSAVKCLLTDREQLTSYLRFPIEHHKRIRLVAGRNDDHFFMRGAARSRYRCAQLTRCLAMACPRPG